MKYSDLLDAHLKYGTTKENINIRNGYEVIPKIVVELFK